VARQGLAVAGVIPAGQDAAVHERVQRLDAPSIFGRAGDVRHLGYRQAAPASAFAVPPVETISKPR